MISDLGYLTFEMKSLWGNNFLNRKQTATFNNNVIWTNNIIF